MREVDYYPELCDKYKKYLLGYLPKDTCISFSYDKRLDEMVADIEEDLGQKSSLSNDFIPKLKLDILFGIMIPKQQAIKFILFEVKYLKQLSLAEFSQLLGYLQVAKNIKLGILSLVLKPGGTSQLSNEFSEIIQMRFLPMEWKMTIQGMNEVHDFKIGISYYTPNNGIDWINTSDINGISNFEKLASALLEK